jgi:hypothetical protein
VPFINGIFNWETSLNSSKPHPAFSILLASLLAAAAIASFAACSRKAEAPRPVLSDPAAGLTVTLPPTASSFTRRAASRDRFVTHVPYAPQQSLLYLHFYSTPLLSADTPPVFYDDTVEAILRDELGAFLTLETTFTNLADQTPAVLLYGRAREPNNVIGFAFQCNKVHFVFIGLSGPDLGPEQVLPFFQTTTARIRIDEVAQSSFADIAQYQAHLARHNDPSQSLDYIRNLFASRNTNPQNYPLAINLAFLLAQHLQAAEPPSPRFAEALALLNNMSAIRLDDYLKARRDFEVAYGQENASEAIAQAKFLAALVYPFDAEGSSLARQRLRKANRLN